MTLFSPDDLNQVFPEATLDALADPNEAVYTGYAEAFVEAQESAGRIALTGGSEDAIGEILEINISTEKISFIDMVNNRINDTKQLLARTKGYSLDDKKNLDFVFDSTDWYKIEHIYNEFNELNLQPEIIFCSEGNSVHYWRIMYKNLNEWVKSFNHEVPNQIHSKKDLLFIEAGVVMNWSKYINLKNEWTVSVIPAFNKLPSNSSEDEIVGTENNSQLLDNIYNEIIKFTRKNFVFPTTENYLMLQALRIMNSQKVLDTDSTTRLFGAHKSMLNDKIYCPAASWNYNDGCVDIKHEDVDKIKSLVLRPIYKENARKK